MGINVGNIEFYSGPKELGAPDNLEKIIINFINGAKDKLEIAVQELENINIAKAIIAARQKGVKVRLVIEQDYLKSKPSDGDDVWVSGGKHEENRLIHSAILRSNIDIKVDYNTKIFHQKFILRDSSSVLTGSTNFTPTGVKNNFNHVVIIHDKKVAKEYIKEFNDIKKGRFGKNGQGHGREPQELTVSNVPIKILFAPEHNPEMEIMKQMLKARKRIDFAIFTFSKSSGIDDTMLRLLEFDMPIRGVFDSAQGKQEWSPLPRISESGADLYAVEKGGNVGKLHHKLMILDDQAVIAGSFNYTKPANILNDENIIILGDLDSTDNAEIEAQKKIARYARKEVDRIIEEYGKQV